MQTLTSHELAAVAGGDFYDNPVPGSIPAAPVSPFLELPPHLRQPLALPPKF